MSGMEQNPYRSPEAPAQESTPTVQRFRLRHVPAVIAMLIVLFILLKLAALFVELGIELIK
jgi:hypothetical protein